MAAKQTLTLLLATASLCAWAQTDVRVSAGLGSSGSRIGPQLGLDLPIDAFQGVYLAVSPSYLAVSDGGVLRLMVTARRKLPFVQPFVRAGLGVGRAGEVNGLVAQLGGGFPILGILGPLSPRFEATAYLSDRPELSGFFVGLTGGF